MQTHRPFSLILHRNQSAHPAVLFCLYFFRISAIAVYILCGLLTDNYVLSVSGRSFDRSFWFLTGLRAGKTVAVVVLLAMDFWNCRVSFHEPRPPTND